MRFHSPLGVRPQSRNFHNIFQSTVNRLWRLAPGILLLLCAWPVLAQTQFATITGRVVDKTGATIPAAIVTLTDTATQAHRETTTGQEGSYTFAAVVPSKYRISVRKEGFSLMQKNFTVAPADRLTEDFSLEVGTTQTIVTVEASAVQVNTTSGEVSHT